MCYSCDMTKLLKKEEIDQLVTYAFSLNANTVLTLDFERSTRKTPVIAFEAKTQNELGTWLWEPNVTAFELEQGVDAAESRGVIYEEYEYEFNNSIQDPVTMLKLIGHAIYNSILSPGWFFSDQKQFYEILLGQTVQFLDGYEEASW